MMLSEKCSIANPDQQLETETSPTKQYSKQRSTSLSSWFIVVSFYNVSSLISRRLAINLELLFLLAIQTG